MSRKIALALLPLLLIVHGVGYAQGRGAIEGRVTDAKSGMALEGANIILKGSAYGTAADVTGRFTIANVPAGTYEVEAYYIGYETASQEVIVIPGGRVFVELSLNSTVLEGGSVIVTATRAVERLTPIAFTNVTKEQMDKVYTTQDVPALMAAVPGVFTASTGLGESDLYIRGFDSERVQVLINGIPVNDPESQVVYWSNWTGLSSNATSIQVQRGVGSSLYGSGAFGGSVNVETMGVPSRRSFSLRNSVGVYTTNGREGEPDAGKVANGEGAFEDYTPVNYMASIRYNSGLTFKGRLIYSLAAERKAGDSYLTGTTYDGWSFGVDAKAILNKHVLTFSFIGAPQDHRQAGANQDMELLDRLGWEYNRYNHPYQENYYFKPQFSLRHDWILSDMVDLSTNYFLTFGRGGGKYLRNDRFNVETGEVGFQDISEVRDNKAFGRNALYIWNITAGRVQLTGFNPSDSMFTGDDGVTNKVTKATPLVASSYEHSWLNDSQNHHDQFGLNTVLRRELDRIATVFLGGELRRWVADHFAESKHFRCANETGGLVEYPEVERRYDYTTTVTNMSGFGRVQFAPMSKVNLVADAQYSRYKSVIEENPIQIFDFQAGRFTDYTYRTTRDLRNSDGSPRFTDKDYERTYTFFSPKLGVNYNLSENVNVLANYSIAHKEPKATDWYNRASGPTNVDLKPEKATTVEFGAGYRSSYLGATVNLYNTDFTDKIESVIDQSDNKLTTNAGKARHQGIELAVNGSYGPIDLSGSLTWSKNRWQKVDVKQLFGVPADSVVDRVVPFAPERMASGAVGYTLGSLRVGLSTRWWDEYYGSYTNHYQLADGTWKVAKLPYFFELNAEVSYGVRLFGSDVKFRLDLNNLTNRQNFTRAEWKADYGRNDGLNGKNYMYVAQSPLFNVFLTTEITF